MNNKVPVKPQVIAHRGGCEWAPENTLAAFKRSLEYGVAGIELDVQRCATGELVVIHDVEISRTTNGAGYLKEITYPELRRLSAGSWFSEEFASEKIPTLEEVLELLDGKLTLHLEIKNAPVEYPGIEDDVLDLLSQYKYPDKVVISSFDHPLLKRIHEKAPQQKTALLADAYFLDFVAYAKEVGAIVWHPGFGNLRKECVQAAHAHSISVNTWTLNKIREWAFAVAIEVDGVITNDPVGLTEFLSRAESTASC
jgi:glycerophosphoryl diester phosphodiesterase